MDQEQEAERERERFKRGLANALHAEFGQRAFDATDVKLKASLGSWLAAAIDEAISDCRYRTGKLSVTRLRKGLRDMTGPLGRLIGNDRYRASLFRVRQPGESLFDYDLDM
jgi:hypothetical protein